jgi:hypothetical protein
MEDFSLAKDGGLENDYTMDCHVFLDIGDISLDGV